MKNVLFVDCCIRGEASRTKKLADAFLSALPADCRVTRLGLMAEDVQMIMGIPLSVSKKSPYFDRKFQK